MNLNVTIMHMAFIRRRIFVFILGAMVVALAFGLAYSLYRLSALTKEYEKKVVEISTLASQISKLEGERLALNETLGEERSKNEEFESQIDDISNTVGNLHKLAQTDPELLAKYSKVYFLNENYVPKRLSLIDTKFRFDPNEEVYFLTAALPKLEELLQRAIADQIDLKIGSGYRSFDVQKGLKNNYTVTYGSGANRFSADQGYSEHQLGTAVDFTTVSLHGSLAGFEKTPAYTWLVNNAHKYGFVLSYPPNNAYYVYEPWHWRYVGEKLAEDLHEDGKYFNDLEQREINEYLVSFFD